MRGYKEPGERGARGTASAVHLEPGKQNLVDAAREPALGPGKQSLVETVFLSRRDAGHTADPPAAFEAATSGPASGVPYRAEMERSFGESFGGVKTYLGGGAVGGLQALGARAAAQGEQIAFESPSPDREVVAHELTHVVQQQRGGAAGPQTKGVSDPSDAAEVEADQVAARVVAGERVTVTASAGAAIHRDLKSPSPQPVPLGEFSIDMKKKENVGGSGGTGGVGGEEGTITFKPNAKAPDSASVRLSQIVRTFNLDTSAENDWSTEGAGEEANRNKIQSKDADASHTCRAGDTLKKIALTHYGDPARHAEIYAANKTVLKSDKPDDPIPTGTVVKVPKAVVGGFFVDHLAHDSRAKPRTSAGDAQVPQDYVWPGEEATNNKHGKKADATIEPAMLFDRPLTPRHLHYTFETVARSDDKGIHYGTMHWEYEVNKGKVSKEGWHVTEGTSDTFASAVTEFDKFYKNEHTVMEGETLASISTRYFGSDAKADDIYQANKAKIPDKAKLAPGIRIKIPGVSP